MLLAFALSTACGVGSDVKSAPKGWKRAQSAEAKAHTRVMSAVSGTRSPPLHPATPPSAEVAYCRAGSVFFCSAH